MISFTVRDDNMLEAHGYGYIFHITPSMCLKKDLLMREIGYFQDNHQGSSCKPAQLNEFCIELKRCFAKMHVVTAQRLGVTLEQYCEINPGSKRYVVGFMLSSVISLPYEGEAPVSLHVDTSAIRLMINKSGYAWRDGVWVSLPTNRGAWLEEMIQVAPLLHGLHDTLKTTAREEWMFLQDQNVIVDIASLRTLMAREVHEEVPLIM